MATNLSTIFPIYDITKKGVIIGDSLGAITVAFKVKFPTVYTVGEKKFEEIIESLRKFVEILGEDTLLHLQNFYFQDYYSLKNLSEDSINDSKIEEFIERSYGQHFSERPYLNSECYLFISKLNEIKKLGTKDEQSEDAFLSNIVNSLSILDKSGLEFNLLSQEELISPSSPLSKFYNFSNAPLEELKDVSFDNNTIYVGSKQIHMYSIQSEMQFPTTDVTYCNNDQGLPTSNMYPFAFNLAVPHVVNQYIYKPNQQEFKTYLEKRLSNLKGFSTAKSKNKEAVDDIDVFNEKCSTEGLAGCYYHFNIMCFDAPKNNIEKYVNKAFSDTSFVKKEVSVSRKDLFLGGIGGNGSRIVSQKNHLMATLVDLEALAHIILEQNHSPETTLASKGLRLCDRVYGIPFVVDIFDKPKKDGIIKNQNVVMISGSGGGKSYLTNTILLNETNAGAHSFIIDASYSYRLQCKLHDGVYLNFDQDNKITFNPFHMEWLKEPLAIELFNSEGIDFKKSPKLNKYNDFLQEKISIISGLITVIVKGEDEKSTRFEENVYRNLLYNFYKYIAENNLVDTLKFDVFYDYTANNLQRLLEEDNIHIEHFNHNMFLSMLKDFRTGNLYGYLLNSEDPKIKNLEKERFVVIDVSRIRGNKILFSIVSILAMDLYNQKIALLPLDTRKFLVIDEAWQSISSPEMATFMKQQVKVIRKYGGATFFISQELDDFISSKIIRESIINNSAIKIFLDMAEFKTKFEPIKKTLAISDETEAKILSINQNNRKGSVYREACISWAGISEVFAVETPHELKAIFETDAEEVAKILPQYERYGIELTAINYANNIKSKL